jgi:hypothetical protein
VKGLQKRGQGATNTPNLKVCGSSKYTQAKAKFSGFFAFSGQRQQQLLSRSQPLAANWDVGKHKLTTAW